MKHYLLPLLCVLALGACSTAAPQGSTKVDVTAQPKKEDPFEITGKIYDMNNVPPPKIEPNDPNVSVYSTDGPLVNPLTEDRTHSVIDNTTAGGYTVFDESVKVFPLPGDDVPAYVPSYAVPPLEGQYAAKQPGMVGEPMGLASAGMLPPVPNMDVKNVPVKKPMSLTSPEPVTMQPPVADLPDTMQSPFDDAGKIAAPAGKPRAPSMLTGVENAAVNPAATIDPDAAFVPPARTHASLTAITAPAAPSAPSPASTMTPGRRSTPLLTGY